MSSFDNITNKANQNVVIFKKKEGKQRLMSAKPNYQKQNSLRPEPKNDYVFIAPESDYEQQYTQNVA